MQGDEFHVLRPVEHAPGENACEPDADASECQTRNERKAHQDPAKDNDIDQQIRKIVLLIEERILVPGNIRVVIDFA